MCETGHKQCPGGAEGQSSSKEPSSQGEIVFTSKSSSPLQGGASAPGTTIKGTVIASRNRPSAERKAAHNNSLCTGTGNKELQTPCLFVLGCCTSVRCENSTVDRQARQKPIHLGHCLLPESLPSLTWARLPVKHHLSCKAFYYLSGIHLRATSSTYSFRFLSS